MSIAMLLIKAPCVARASVSNNGILTMCDMPPWWAAIHLFKHHEDDLNDRFCVFCAVPNNDAMKAFLSRFPIHSMAYMYRPKL